MQPIVRTRAAPRRACSSQARRRLDAGNLPHAVSAARRLVAGKPWTARSRRVGWLLDCSDRVADVMPT